MSEEEDVYYHHYLPYFNRHKQVLDERFSVLESVFFGSVQLFITISLASIAFGSAIMGGKIVNSLGFYFSIFAIISGVITLVWAMSNFERIVLDKKDILTEANRLLKDKNYDDLKKKVKESYENSEGDLIIKSVKYLGVATLVFFSFGFGLLVYDIQMHVG